MVKAQYIAGIDLGTTNIVVSYIPLSDINEENKNIELFGIKQEQAKGAIESFDVMPSFIFQRLKEKPVFEWETDYIIGQYARERGEEVPDRLVSSAKSWLCNSKVNRQNEILPWEAPETAKKISPVDAVAMFLKHIQNTWDQQFPKQKLKNQKVIITIPASFDAAARDLTIEAAKRASIENVTLLEEPQAAFYAWIDQKSNPWRKQVKKGELILVVDVGGGTTDFSLIKTEEKSGDLMLERVAVGNHILLGGDNMDLTLAYIACQKLIEQNKKVSQWQTMQLRHQCRKAKEILLADPSKKSVPVVVSGRGKSVIGGALKTTIDREDIEKTLVEGFFPDCDIDTKTNKQTSSGIKELDLMYSSDPAITRHLAEFLYNQGDSDSGPVYPNAVLFNGGVFKSDIFRNKLVSAINSWCKSASKEEIKVLEGFELSEAVAKGAVCFGITREGKGIRIRGGVSQSYYLGIESAMPAVPGFSPPMKALCIASQGTEEGTTKDIPERYFSILTGQQAKFKLFRSNCRREDEFAQIIEDIDDTFEDTNPLEIKLPVPKGKQEGEVVEVSLQISITEVGTLEVYCIEKDGENRWKLEFNVRDSIS